MPSAWRRARQTWNGEINKGPTRRLGGPNARHPRGQPGVVQDDPNEVQVEPRFCLAEQMGPACRAEPAARRIAAVRDARIVGQQPSIVTAALPAPRYWQKAAPAGPRRHRRGDGAKPDRAERASAVDQHLRPSRQNLAGSIQRRSEASRIPVQPYVVSTWQSANTLSWVKNSSHPPLTGVISMVARVASAENFGTAKENASRPESLRSVRMNRPLTALPLRPGPFHPPIGRHWRMLTH
jgi:hypothetical protein